MLPRRPKSDEQQSPTTTGTITGRVVNESGQPLSNASVFIRGSQPLLQPRTTTTDSEGNFQVAGLEPVLYGISASAPGLRHASARSGQSAKLLSSGRLGDAEPGKGWSYHRLSPVGPTASLWFKLPFER